MDTEILRVPESQARQTQQHSPLTVQSLERNQVTPLSQPSSQELSQGTPQQPYQEQARLHHLTSSENVTISGRKKGQEQQEQHGISQHTCANQAVPPKAEHVGRSSTITTTSFQVPPAQISPQLAVSGPVKATAVATGTPAGRDSDQPGLVQKSGDHQHPTRPEKAPGRSTGKHQSTKLLPSPQNPLQEQEQSTDLSLKQNHGSHKPRSTSIHSSEMSEGNNHPSENRSSQAKYCQYCGNKMLSPEATICNSCSRRQRNISSNTHLKQDSSVVSTSAAKTKQPPTSLTSGGKTTSSKNKTITHVSISTPLY